MFVPPAVSAITAIVTDVDQQERSCCGEETEGSSRCRGPFVGRGHHFLRNKRTEWREYRRQVTEFELGRYLPIL
ncbi:hypothetical protein [Microtetraspora malaysiensis]|uniref:hypothetical protein n=1 Tax=Microtetraspora malaysiensis TaxID=161358 RepID=UPI003D919B64